MAIKMGSHEDSCTTFRDGSLTTKTVDLAIILNLVVTKSCKLNFVTFVLDLLWGGVILLLTFLTTSSQSKYKMKSRFFLNVVITQSSSIFKLFASKNQSLLVWGNTFFILNFGFHIFNGIRSLDLKSDGLSR